MTPTDDPARLVVREPVVELRHASVGYGDKPVVRDVSLRIDRGEVVALVGPNGSGKTTVVRGLLGLARVVGGEVRLFGVPAAQFRERWRIGYVPQRHTVVGAVPSTVEEVVASGRLPRRRWWSPSTAGDRAVVGQAIDVVGLAERRRAPVSTLSGGQQRRVLIARALAAEPEVLVMDEPTAGVDAASSEALTRTLSRLVDDGLTLLVVTHDVAPLAPILTRVLVVADGQVVGDEPAAVALSPGSALGARLYAHPGHDPHHTAAGDSGAPDDPVRSPRARMARRPRSARRATGRLRTITRTAATWNCSTTTSCSALCSRRCSSGSPPPSSACTSCSAGSR